MRRRHQAVLLGPDDEPLDESVVGLSTFLPGQIPPRYQPDPRTTAKWRRIRREVLARDHYLCRGCGAPASDVDHRVELIDGGRPYDPENLQALCEACHDAKSSESRYARAVRSTSTWGRMALCPKCSGSGRCVDCLTTPHECTSCLGVRFIPERCEQRGEIPSQSVLAQVSSLAWEGAKPPSP
jgi:5-methylcytosine-specific restriction enzyme A